jgi:hypothetical protein
MVNAITSKYRVQATFWIQKSRARSNEVMNDD